MRTSPAQCGMIFQSTGTRIMCPPTTSIFSTVIVIRVLWLFVDS